MPGTLIDVELPVFTGRFESLFNFVDVSGWYSSIVFPKETNDRTGHICSLIQSRGCAGGSVVPRDYAATVVNGRRLDARNSMGCQVDYATAKAVTNDTDTLVGAIFSLQVGDERWSVAFYSRIPISLISWEAALAGLFGLVTTLSVVSYGRYLFTKASQSKFQAEESTKALKTKEEAYRHSLDQLKRAEERYSDLFEKSQALIWTQELDGKIRSLNPAAADSLGYRPEEMKGKSLKDFILPTERHTFGNYLERCKNSDTTRGLLKLYTKNGATRFWMYQTSLSHDDKDPSVRCHALDVTESQQAERELERLSRRNELILESVGEGIYGINLAGECTFVNPAAIEFTGHSREELMSAARTMHEILQPKKPDGSDYLWEESASYDTLTDGEIRRGSGEEMVRKDGSWFPVDYVVTPIVEDDDRILGAVVTFQDVTARRAVEQMKNEFISIVSHELRTPLTSIRGSLGLLASGLLLKFPQKADKMLKIAVENTDRLVRLINDILDIAKIEAGKMTIDPKPIDLVDPVDAAVRMIRRKAEDKDITLSLQADEPLPEVDADHRAVRQMVLNLLSNAIKFTDPGGRILVAVQKKDDFVRVAVRDTGVGIPKEHLPRLAQPFEQVHETRERNYDGTGLGLALTKSFAEMHGGRFSIASEVGRGTMVSFFLPVSRDVPSRDRDVA